MIRHSERSVRIRGIGVDIVEVKRFAQWHNYSPKKLQRIFSQQEIAYCLQQPDASSAQRFAVRFAAKEALVKALSAAGFLFPLLYVCRHVSIDKQTRNGNPMFVLSHELNAKITQKIGLHVSLSHAKEYAMAFVLVEQG